VNARNSLNRAHRAAFHEQAHDLFNLFLSLVGSVQLLRTFGIGFVALAATEALVTLAVTPKLLAFRAAVVASHFDPCFLRALEPK
jgi:hypothetical protein